MSNIFESNAVTQSSSTPAIMRGNGTTLWFGSRSSPMPDSIALHYDAQAMSASDGDAIATLPDSSGNGNDATGTGTYQTGVINSYPGIYVNGSNDGFLSSNGTLTQPNTVLIVYRPDHSTGLSGPSNVFASDDVNARNQYYWDGSKWDLYCGSHLYGTDDMTLRLASFVVDGTDSVMYEDDTQVSSGDPGSLDSSTVSLGYNEAASGQYWPGWIGEVRVFDADLRQTGEFGTQRAELLDKWGIKTYSWTRTTISTGENTDGQYAIDLDGDGKVDAVRAGGSDNAAQWFQQGASASDWTEYTIDNSLSEPEWVWAGDLSGSGDIYVTIAEQGSGDLTLAYHGGDPTNAWSKTVLDSNAPSVRDHIFADVSGTGDLDIIYSYEGHQAGEGGIYWLENGGGDVTQASNWTKHEIAQVDGAILGAVERRDLSGDGNATDIMGATRIHGNPDATREVYWLEEPSDPTNTWSKNTIDTDMYGGNGDFGNFFGNGHKKDFVMGAGDVDSGLFLWDYSNGWSRTEITSVSTTGWYGVYAHNLDTSTDRHEIVGGHATDEDLLLLSWNGSEYVEELRESPYEKAEFHQFIDINGDGNVDLFTGNNVHNPGPGLDWFDLTLS